MENLYLSNYFNKNPLPDNIFIGTSGFYYKDWVGRVYPKNLPQKQWLDFYTNYFNSLEINSTYYRDPDLNFIKNICNRIKNKKFLLSFKANKNITHERNSNDIRKYSDIVNYLVENYFEARVLYQFPYSFKYNQSNFDYIKKIINLNKRFVIEFRNEDWINKDIVDTFKEEKASIVSVDEPQIGNLMKRRLYKTGDIYIRFHGRNREKWWNHEKAYERYDYLYEPKELETWISKLIVPQKSIIIIYFNNHYHGNAFLNARQYLQMFTSLKKWKINKQ